jgi:hypothetical protein
MIATGLTALNTKIWIAVENYAVNKNIEFASNAEKMIALGWIKVTSINDWAFSVSENISRETLTFMATAKGILVDPYVHPWSLIN